MFRKIKPVASAEELAQMLTVPRYLAENRIDAVNQISRIISGEDNRKLVIVGPCSADNQDAVCDYSERLARVAQKIKSSVYVVMRVHTSKPRTRGEGYMGMIHMPDISSGITDLNDGLRAARSLHLRVAETSGLFTSDEMLYPHCIRYISDIVAYLTLGARSAEDQEHRFFASGTDVPIGIKNPPSGSVYDLSGSVHAVRIPNEFLTDGYQVQSSGNVWAHAILRGYVDIDGNNIPNYGKEYVRKYTEIYCAQSAVVPSVVIDTGHANSGKNRMIQSDIVGEVLSLCANDRAYNSVVKGFMIESYIVDGNQPFGGGIYGRSITDPCLGWNKTERLLYDIAEKLGT